MAIGYKVKIPKNVDEVHQNVQDIAESAMNKQVMTKDMKAIESTAIGTASVTYDASQVQKIIDQQSTILDKLNDIINRFLKS